MQLAVCVCVCVCVCVFLLLSVFFLLSVCIYMYTYDCYFYTDEDIGVFSWDEFLTTTGTVAAATELFKKVNYIFIDFIFFCIRIVIQLPRVKMVSNI